MASRVIATTNEERWRQRAGREILSRAAHEIIPGMRFDVRHLGAPMGDLELAQFTLRIVAVAAGLIDSVDNGR